jgi:hypothetical protein
MSVLTDESPSVTLEGLTQEIICFVAKQLICHKLYTIKHGIL